MEDVAHNLATKVDEDLQSYWELAAARRAAEATERVERPSRFHHVKPLFDHGDVGADETYRGFEGRGWDR